MLYLQDLYNIDKISVYAIKFTDHTTSLFVFEFREMYSQPQREIYWLTRWRVCSSLTADLAITRVMHELGNYILVFELVMPAMYDHTLEHDISLSDDVFDREDYTNYPPDRQPTTRLLHRGPKVQGNVSHITTNDIFKSLDHPTAYYTMMTL